MECSVDTACRKYGLMCRIGAVSSMPSSVGDQLGVVSCGNRELVPSCHTNYVHHMGVACGRLLGFLSHNRQAVVSI